MIIKLHRAGKSFKGVVRYLTHDKDKAETSKRLAWTHTLNLANDGNNISSAVDEMLWTCRASDALKRAAGVGTGGSKLERPVKHFSLSWHESQNPNREHMIEAVQKYLAHMGWQDRQAILMAHNDTRHAHVHVVLNAVSPFDGRSLDASFERRRSQAFGLDYEREQGLIFCEERLKPRRERAPSPTREAWQRITHLGQSFERAEVESAVKDFGYFDREDSALRKDKEWQALKARQRQEREDFFMEGKPLFRAARNAAYREVRTEFKNEWRAFYEAVREGKEGKERLAECKAKILAEQKTTLDERAKSAYEAITLRRKPAREALLVEQKLERADLKERQRLGLRSFEVLEREPKAPRIPRTIGDQAAAAERGREFRRGKAEVTERRTAARPSRVGEAEPIPSYARAAPAPGRARAGKAVDGMTRMGLGGLGAIASIGENLFDGFFGGGDVSAKEPVPPPPVKQRQPDPVDPQEHAAMQAAQAREAEAARLEAFWAERRERRRERD